MMNLYWTMFSSMNRIVILQLSPKLLCSKSSIIFSRHRVPSQTAVVHPKRWWSKIDYQPTHLQPKKVLKLKTLKNCFSANMASYGTTTTPTRSLWHLFRSLPVLHIQAPDGKTSVTGSRPSSSSSFLFLVSPTAKCVMTQVIWQQSAHYWHKLTSYSWLLSVLRICTSWVQKELSKVKTEADTST